MARRNKTGDEMFLRNLSVQQSVFYIYLCHMILKSFMKTNLTFYMKTFFRCKYNICTNRVQIQYLENCEGKVLYQNLFRCFTKCKIFYEINNIS